MEAIGTGSDANLTQDEINRYSRHLILPEVGVSGQKKLRESSVLLVGTGGLGSPMAMYLAAAGVGRMGLVDFDVVDESNLQRQILHGTKDVGRSKLESARERVLDINPNVHVDLFETRLTSENALRILPDYDVVADGTDNFPTRYLVNDACVLTGKTNAYASIFRFEGQVSVFGAPDGPCYRCVYPEPPPPGLVPSCAEGGVLGVLPGIVGTLQANEVIKLLLGIGEPLVGRLLLLDALGASFRTLKLRRDPACPVCGDNPTVNELIDYEQFCGIPSLETNGQVAVATSAHSTVPEITVEELHRRIADGSAPYVLDVRNPYEVEIATFGHDLLIPVDELPDRVGELPSDTGREIVILCRSGVRSARAVGILTDAGYTNAWNITGGILAWSDAVDPSIPKY